MHLFIFILGYLCCAITVVLALFINRMNKLYNLELYDACCDIINIIHRYQLIEKEKAIYEIAAKIKKEMEEK